MLNKQSFQSKREAGANSTACAAAIDLGASSGRVIVGSYGASNGLTLREVHRFANGLAMVDGHLVWDVEAIVEEVLIGLSRAAELGATTCGIDTWGVDYGFIDEDGQLCGPVVGYRDDRTEGVAEGLRGQGLCGEAYERTGLPLLDINTLSQLISQKRDEAGIPDGLCLLMVPDLITYFLTGSCGTEASIASTTQLLNANSKQWDSIMLDLAGIDPTCMPAIKQLGSDAGCIKDESTLGMRMLRVCEHDTASAVASIELQPHDVFISCGTWSLVGVERNEPILTEEAERAGLSNETGADGRTLLLSNCTGLWIAQQLKPELEARMERELSWEEIAAEVALLPGSTFVFDTEDPMLAQPGDMLDKLEMLGRAAGYGGPFGVAQFYRAIYESLAMRYRDVIDHLQELTGDCCTRIRIIGGGSQNSALCQLVADVCTRKVVAGPHEASAVGNLLVQMTAQGAFGSLEEARLAVGTSMQYAVYLPQDFENSDPERGVSC